MSRSKSIGTRAETAVVRFLQAQGFPAAERRALRGVLDAGDVTGTPGVCWEVKGGEAARSASDLQVQAWLVQTEIERVHAQADVGVLVLQRRGVGPANAGRWWAIIDAALLGLPEAVPVRLTLEDAVTLLRSLGWGTPLGAS